MVNPMANLELGDVNANCLIIDKLFQNDDTHTAVYSAADRVSGDLVILKRLGFTEKCGRDGFNNEMMALSLFDQEEGFPKLVSYGFMGDGAYIVMTYEGDFDLKDLARSRSPDSYSTKELEIDLQIAHQLTRRVETLHQYGIIQRDVKPTNVLLSNEGLVSLIDFNISSFGQKRVVDNRSVLCAPIMDQLSGTLRYSSPEHFREENLPGYSEFSDVRAMGATLYSLINGTWKNPRLTYADIVEDKILPELKESRKSVNSRVFELLHWATAKDWKQRPTAKKLREVGLEPLMKEMGIDWGELPNIEFTRVPPPQPDFVANLLRQLLTTQ